MESNKLDLAYDIHGLLDLVKEGRIEPVTLWKHFASKWDDEERLTFFIALLGVITKEEREQRQDGIAYQSAKYHASYFGEKMNEARQLRAEQKVSVLDESSLPQELDSEEEGLGYANSAEQEESILVELSLPQELNTERARIYFANAIDAGFMDENYNFIGTRYQQAYFAELMSEKLGLKHKWKPFKILWSFENFAQTRRESKERFGKVDREDEIDKLFN